MEKTNFLIFEIGSECNLGYCHPKCPVSFRSRVGKELDDSTIIKFVIDAYNKFGFTGLIGWHFYNEPMIQGNRIFNLMERIRELVPQSRFILWTNGTIIYLDERAKLFEQIHVSDYFNKEKFLKDCYKDVKVLDIFVPHFDSRLNDTGNNEISYDRCLRPYIEMIFDNFGEVHLCCQDWKGEIKIGNIWNEDFGTILERRKNIMDKICGNNMCQDAPDRCLRCQNRIIDESIIQKFK